MNPTYPKMPQLLKYAGIFCFASSSAPIFLAEILLHYLNSLELAALPLALPAIILEGLILCAGLVFAIRLLRRNIDLRRVWLPAILTIIASFMFAVLCYRYRLLLGNLRFETILILFCLVVPSLMLTLAMAISLRGVSEFASLLICLVGFLIIGIGLFEGTKLFKHSYQQESLLKRLQTAPYAYYLPAHLSSDERLNFYAGDADFSKGISISSATTTADDQTIRLMSIDEHPRNDMNIESACGHDLSATYLRYLNPVDYSCVKIADSPNGPIYEVAFTVPSFQIQGSRVKEYALLTKTTYVYATYQSITNDTLRIYDKDQSIKLLQSMEPVSPEQFLKYFLPNSQSTF